MIKKIFFGKFKLNKIHKLYYFVLIFFFLFLYHINSISPLVGEDLILTPWSYGKEPTTLLSKFVFVFNRVYFQASNWNARIGELLAIITGAFNKNLFNFLNSLIVTVLIVTLFVIGFGRYPNYKKKQDVVGLFVLIFLYICLNPLLGELTFWKSGTLNHTWGITFLLLFFIPYRLNLLNKFDFNLSPYQIALYSFIGFFVGFSIESACWIVVGMIFTLLFYKIIRKQEIKLGFILPFFSFSLGTITLLILPSTTIRRHYYESLNIYGDSSGIEMYFERFKIILTEYIKITWPLILILFLLSFIWLALNSQKTKKFLDFKFLLSHKSFITKSNLIILLFSLLAVFSLVTIPFHSDQKRGFAFHWYILFAMIAYIFMKIWDFIKEDRYKKIILVLFLTILVINGFFIAKSYEKFYEEVIARDASIYSQIENGEEVLYIEPLKVKSSRILTTREIYFKNTSNTLMSTFYGVNLIIFQNRETTLGEISYSSNLQLNIEHIEKLENNITISGWAFINRIDSKNYNIFVLLKNIENGNETIFSTESVERVDVAEYFNGPYIHTGFTSSFSEEKLAQGNYQVGVVIMIDQNKIGGLSETIVKVSANN